MLASSLLHLGGIVGHTLMGLFVVINTAGDPIETQIMTAFPNDYLKLTDKSWLVAAQPTMTSKDVWEKITGAGGTPAQPSTNGVVFSFSGYFGLAPSSVWEWIAVRRSKEA